MSISNIIKVVPLNCTPGGSIETKIPGKWEGVEGCEVSHFIWWKHLYTCYYNDMCRSVGVKFMSIEFFSISLIEWIP